MPLLDSGTVNTLKTPPHGFGEFEVPEMPAYIQSYSKRGNAFDAETTPVYQQVRWGNRRGRGGMNAYLSHAEDATYFDGFREKKGNHGVYERIRWAPGYDWRGNFGVASLSQIKNYAGIPTRGGQLRKGAPRRGDYLERVNAWWERARPGIGVSRYSQNNNNYAGLYEWRRRTPFIQRDNDPLVLRDMIEHNPFHISSHSAKQAKEWWMRENINQVDHGVPAYRSGIDAFATTSRQKMTIQDDDPRVVYVP